MIDGFVSFSEESTCPECNWNIPTKCHFLGHGVEPGTAAPSVCSQRARARGDINGCVTLLLRHHHLWVSVSTSPPWHMAAFVNRSWRRWHWLWGVRAFPSPLLTRGTHNCGPPSKTKNPHTWWIPPKLWENRRTTSLIALLAFTLGVTITPRAAQPCKNEAASEEVGGVWPAWKTDRNLLVTPLPSWSPPQLVRVSQGQLGPSPCFPTPASGHSDLDGLPHVAPSVFCLSSLPIWNHRQQVPWAREGRRSTVWGTGGAQGFERERVSESERTMRKSTGLTQQG